MIISSSEFIMNSVSQCPMKMPERRSLQRVNWEKLGCWSLGTNEQQEKWVRWCEGAEMKNFVKDVMETQSCEYGFI